MNDRRQNHKRPEEKGPKPEKKSLLQTAKRFRIVDTSRYTAGRYTKRVERAANRNFRNQINLGYL